MTNRACTYLGCDAAATRIVKAKYTRPSYGCKKHWPAMEKAAWIGQATDGGSVLCRLIRPGDLVPSEAPRFVPEQRLNWGINSKRKGWLSSHSKPCVTCGKRTVLVNPDGQHQHKQCAERELARI